MYEFKSVSKALFILFRVLIIPLGEALVINGLYSQHIIQSTHSSTHVTVMVVAVPASPAAAVEPAASVTLAGGSLCDSIHSSFSE